MRQMQDSLEDYLYDCTSIFMDYDQWTLAKEWLDRLKGAFPDHPSLPIMEAEIEMGLDDYEDAYTLLKEILEAEPYDSEAWDLMAETCVALDEFNEALEAADYALAINPKDSTALLMKANAYMHEGPAAEAIEHYRQYLELQPDDLSVQISLALCYSSEERWGEALPVLEKAETLALKQPEREADLSQVLQLKAFALSRLDRIPEAITLVQKAREYCEESMSWKCHLTEGDIRLQARQTNQAEESFTKALEKSPEKGDTLFNIALSYSNAGYNDVAIDLLDDVWTMFGTQEGKFVVPYLANCYLRKNDMKNYLKYLNLASYCDREATKFLFHDRYPNIAPEEYYAYAFKEVYGFFPKDNTASQDNGEILYPETD